MSSYLKLNDNGRVAGFSTIIKDLMSKIFKLIRNVLIKKSALESL